MDLSLSLSVSVSAGLARHMHMAYGAVWEVHVVRVALLGGHTAKLDTPKSSSSPHTKQMRELCCAASLRDMRREGAVQNSCSSYSGRFMRLQSFSLILS